MNAKSEIFVGMRIIYHSNLYDKEHDRLYHGFINKIDRKMQRVCIKLTEKINDIIEDVNCSLSNIDQDSSSNEPLNL